MGADTYVYGPPHGADAKDKASGNPRDKGVDGVSLLYTDPTDMRASERSLGEPPQLPRSRRDRGARARERTAVSIGWGRSLPHGREDSDAGLDSMSKGQTYRKGKHALPGWEVWNGMIQQARTAYKLTTHRRESDAGASAGGERQPLPHSIDDLSVEAARCMQ